MHISNPEEKGDWIYVHDLVRAALLVWNAPAASRRFYTVCGELLTTRQVAEAAQRVFPHVAVTYEEGALSSNPYAVDFDDSPLRTEFAFRPEFTIEAAIRDYARSMGAS